MTMDSNRLATEKHRSVAVAFPQAPNVDEAIISLNRAIRAALRSPAPNRLSAASLRVTLAESLFGRGDRSGTRRLLRLALRDLPPATPAALERARALRLFGRLEFSESQFRKSASCFARAVRLLSRCEGATADDLAQAWVNFAITQSILTRADKAVTSLHRALSFPAAPRILERAQYSLANAYERLGQFAKAGPIYDRLLRDASVLRSAICEAGTRSRVLYRR